MTLLKREEFQHLVRDVDWTLSYVDDDAVYPEWMSGTGREPRPEPGVVGRPAGARSGHRDELTAGSTATGSRTAWWWFAFRGVARTVCARSSSTGPDSVPLAARRVSSAVSQCS
jgi:hypothetical protein